jgi:hypothetical protein
LEGGNQVGTISAEFYEAFPTSGPQSFLFVNPKKEPTAPEEKPKVLTSDKPAETKIESVPSVPVVVVKEKPTPVKPTIFEDATQDNKKFWTTPALLTIPGKKLFGPYVPPPPRPPPNEKTEEPKTITEKTTEVTQSNTTVLNNGKDNEKNNKEHIEKEVCLPTALKPVENEDKFDFHWNKG